MIGIGESDAAHAEFAGQRQGAVHTFKSVQIARAAAAVPPLQGAQAGHAFGPCQEINDAAAHGSDKSREAV